MSLLVVGSIAIDSVQTPQEEVSEALGGSAAYFAYAASFFSPVRVVGVVGEDFPDHYMSLIADRPNIDVSGIQKSSGKTFRWKGRYLPDMNQRETLEVQLNVFGEFDPVIPDHYRDSPFVFLANGSPVVQRKVLHQVNKPKLIVADTMDLWIETQRDDLVQLMTEIDGLVLNDSEALLLTEEKLLVQAAKKLITMGPKFVIIKKGEHGAMFASESGILTMPAYPTPFVIDPTGAGDSFAGGLMGYLSSQTTHDAATFKRGMVFATVTASINVEGFSLSRFQQIDKPDIDKRFREYCEMLRVD